MKTKFLLFVGLFLAILVFACTSPKSANVAQVNDSGKLRVLCTTGMIRNLAEEIGKEHVIAQSLIKEDMDPHTYELVKGDDEKLLCADVVFYNGLGLEHSPNIRKHLKSHPKSFCLGDYVQQKRPDEILVIEGELDPHIWMDVSLWDTALDQVKEGLIECDPEHKEHYEENAKLLHEQMNTLHQEIVTLMGEIPEKERYLVTCHDAFNYFTKRYLATDAELKDGSWTERCKAPEGLSPDSQLSLHDIKAVVDHLDKYQIEVIFPESNVNTDSIQKIKDITHKKGRVLYISPFVLYADSMSPKGEPQDTYLKMIRYNAEIISKCLKSKSAYEQSARPCR